MLEVKAKDEGHNAEVFSKKKVLLSKFSKKVFRDLQKQKKTQKRSLPTKSQNFNKIQASKFFFRKFSGMLQNKTLLLMTLAHFQPVKK